MPSARRTKDHRFENSNNKLCSTHCLSAAQKHGPRWFNLKENKALSKYSDNVFPCALLMALTCGTEKQLLETPPTRPFQVKATATRTVEFAHVDITCLEATCCVPGGYNTAQVQREAVQRGRRAAPARHGPYQLHGRQRALRAARVGLTGENFCDWRALSPSAEARRKYAKRKHAEKAKRDKIEQMVIKLDSRYQWQEREEKLHKHKAQSELDEPECEYKQLRVHCFQARNLANADVHGLTDAYLEVIYFSIILFEYILILKRCASAATRSGRRSCTTASTRSGTRRFR